MILTASRTAVDRRGPFSCLSAEELLQMYRNMLLARALSERMGLLNRSGKAPLVITCEGHDFVLSYYRDLGVVLTLGMTPLEVMLNAFHRAADPKSGGRQMPGHWSLPRLRVVSHSSPVAHRYSTRWESLMPPISEAKTTRLLGRLVLPPGGTSSLRRRSPWRTVPLPEYRVFHMPHPGAEGPGSLYTS